MKSEFQEYEGENALRTFPFASGCNVKDIKGKSIAPKTLIDAVFYPVNSTGRLWLSKISLDGIVSISDDKKVIMTATLENGSSMLEFYDYTEHHRHCGTIMASSPEALAGLVNIDEDRKFRKANAYFASSCIFPIDDDGVIGIKVEDVGIKTGTVEFANTDTYEIRVSSEDSESIRFDIVPSPLDIELSSIQHIICVVDGKTPFRIERMPYTVSDDSEAPCNTIAVYLDNIDKSVVCSSIHRENSLEMIDQCECSESPEETVVEIPEFYQAEVVNIPHGADSAFYLVTPNMTGYDNPLSITLEEGDTIPKTEVDIDINADDNGTLTDNVASNAVILQVPGLNGANRS